MAVSSLSILTDLDTLETVEFSVYPVEQTVHTVTPTCRFGDPRLEVLRHRGGWLRSQYEQDRNLLFK